VRLSICVFRLNCWSINDDGW